MLGSCDVCGRRGPLFSSKSCRSCFRARLTFLRQLREACVAALDISKSVVLL